MKGRVGFTAFVTRSDDNDYSVGHSVANSSIERRAGATPKTQVENCRYACGVVGDGPIDSIDNPRGGTTSPTVKDPHWNERDGFGDSVSRATNGASDMGAVTIAVGGVARNDWCNQAP